MSEQHPTPSSGPDGEGAVPPGDPPWSIEDAAELYNVAGWSNDYFSIGEAGRLLVHPGGPGTASIDLEALVTEVRERGIEPPLLFRFSEIVAARVVELNEAFRAAMEEYGYRGGYRGVYPIKVNQDRYLVERVVEFGRPYHFGLEAGSKPELLAVMALVDDPEALIVCNGYKDREYVETALLASKLGRRVVLVVEKASELELIVEVARRTGIEPLVGARARLSTRGAGHWEGSGGDRSKFGLSARDLLAAVELLGEEGLLHRFQLLHFHLGSQISSIRSIKQGVREAAWTYVNLVEMGAGMKYLDVGGGLGVDYEGTRSDAVSSMNYTLREYVNDVVYGVLEVCEERGIAHPVLVTESGRATVAHHAVLVTDVLGVVKLAVQPVREDPPEDAPAPLVNLFDAYHEARPDHLLEAYHDALGAREDCRNLFKLGHLSLAGRGLAEDLFWATCRKIHDLAAERARVEGEDEVPDELRGLATELADTYFCNFSVFQSVPDSWAIEQVFPVMPIHRLDERPDRHGVIADITCDSDGKIDRFIERGTDKRTAEKRALELHRFTGEPYYIGAFLVGAYQEILGDLHNLFGDTNEVIVSLDPAAGYRIDEVVAGDTVTDVLRYVSFSRRDLLARVRRAAEAALRDRRMSREESRHLLEVYEKGLAGYTYLESD